MGWGGGVSVVYFDQLSGAAPTQKLVELLFFCCETTEKGLKWTKKLEKDMCLINSIQILLKIDEQEWDRCAFKETSAQWLDYNINNKKYA